MKTIPKPGSNGDYRNLLKRHRTWYLRYKLSPRAAAIIGKTEIVISLKTQDIQQARLARYDVLAAVKKYVAGQVGQAQPPRSDLLGEVVAKEWRDRVEGARPVEVDPRIQQTQQDEVMTSAILEGLRLEDEKGPEAVQGFIEIIAGTSALNPRLVDLIDEYLEEKDNAKHHPRAIKQHRATIMRFIEWTNGQTVDIKQPDGRILRKSLSGNNVLVRDVTKLLAHRWVQSLRKDDLEISTVNKMVAHMARYWTTLRILVGDDIGKPWGKEVKIPAPTQGVADETRDRFEPELLTLMLNTIVDGTCPPPLADAILLALWTGRREGSIANICKRDIKVDADGNVSWDLTRAKTKNGLGMLPVPAIIADILIRRRDATARDDMPIFPEFGGSTINWKLKPQELKTALENRAATLGVRFGVYKRKLGITSRQRVFHSFRHNMSKMMSNCGIDVSNREFILGQANKSIADNVYNKGGPSTIGKIMEVCTYGPEIDALTVAAVKAGAKG